MATLLALRKAIIERLGTDWDFTYYWHVPSTVETPAMFITPDFPFVDYQQAYSSLAVWNLLLTLVVDRIDEEAAQEQLSDWVDPAGPIVAALTATDVDDTLARLSNNHVAVTTGGDFDESRLGRNTYYLAQLRVSIKA